MEQLAVASVSLHLFAELMKLSVKCEDIYIGDGCYSKSLASKIKASFTSFPASLHTSALLHAFSRILKATRLYDEETNNISFFTSAIALAIIGFTSAAPLNVQTTFECPNPTDPGTSPAQIIRPDATSQYKVWTGAIDHYTQGGRIFKDSKTTNITALLTFSFPAESADKTCSFHFDLSDDSTAEISGTGQLDVFTSLAPADYSTSSWPPGNLRDQHIGRMTAKAGGEAEWVSGFPTFGQGFLCPAGQTYGGELVSVGDNDLIDWLAASGPYIQYE